MCDNNFPYYFYEGTEYLDDDGSKPCFDCLLESGAFDEEKSEE